MFGNQRVGGGNTAGFANSDTEAKGEQLPIAGRKAAQRGEPAPDRQRPRDYPASPGSVGEIGQGQSEDRVEQGEGQAPDGAELGIGEVEVSLDRRVQDPEDLPVEEVEDVGEQKERQEDAGLGPAPSRSRACAQKFKPSDTNTCRGLP
jgi:hypothetical protein